MFKIKMKENKWGLGIGDWGLGIGDWAQSPIPIYHFNLQLKNNSKIIKYLNISKI